MKYKRYVLILEGAEGAVAQALARWSKHEFASLGEAREVSRAIKALFPEVMTRIVSAAVPRRARQRVLDG